MTVCPQPQHHHNPANVVAGLHILAELVLKQPGVIINARSNTNATPLHEAAVKGNVLMLQLLLRHGAVPLDTSPGFSALHAACMGSCSHLPAAVRTSTPAQLPVEVQDSMTEQGLAAIGVCDPSQQACQASSLPGQLKPVLSRGPASTTAAKPQQLRPRPPAPQLNKSSAAPAPRTIAASKAPAGPGRAAVSSTRYAAGTSRSTARPTHAPASPAAAAENIPTSGQVSAQDSAAVSGLAMPAAGLHHVSSEAVSVLLEAAPELLQLKVNALHHQAFTSTPVRQQDYAAAQS